VKNPDRRRNESGFAQAPHLLDPYFTHVSPRMDALTGRPPRRNTFSAAVAVTYKRLIVWMANHGLISNSLAVGLIRRGGLSHD
jgi:hypothetical protein